MLPSIPVAVAVGLGVVSPLASGSFRGDLLRCHGCWGTAANARLQLPKFFRLSEACANAGKRREEAAFLHKVV